ncbi:MAG: hypothetical protein JNN17_10400 [Verrucomicrobiaceae bacterium]|nr:hypothetical protein [Verrucomicrobiaceae bacterium]
MRPAIATSLLLAVSTLMARDEEKSVSGDQERFLAVLTKNFAAWDADHDGLLAANEINNLVEAPEVRGEDAAAIAALKRASRFRIVTLPSFTLEHLQTLAKAQPLEKGMPDLPAMFGGSLKHIAKTKHELFAPEGPRIETIRQGRMGNCFSLAPLAALAHERPDYIREQMIRPIENGRYVVKLGQQEIEVAAPTDAEIALTSENEDGSVWVNVYEKAAGVAHNAKKPADKRDATGLDALSRGGSAGTQLAFITGREMFRVSCSFAKKKDLPKADYDKHMAELRAALTSATKENRLMTCGTLKTTIPGLTPNHAYAILSYYSATDVIRVWNPHGDTREVKGEPGPKSGYPIKDGIFELPLTVFVKEFSGTAYEVISTSLNLAQ